MCDQTPFAEVSLPADLSAGRRAREFVRRSLCVRQAGVLDRALLLISELAVNAVEHGAPPVSAEVHCEGADGIRVAVHDGSAVRPVVRAVGLDAESGRGVGLLDAVSDGWGVDVGEVGKTVWCRLRS